MSMIDGILDAFALVYRFGLDDLSFFHLVWCSIHSYALECVSSSRKCRCKVLRLNKDTSREGLSIPDNPVVVEIFRLPMPV
jgi:hypothetical protein